MNSRRSTTSKWELDAEVIELERQNEILEDENVELKKLVSTYMEKDKKVSGQQQPENSSQFCHVWTKIGRCRLAGPGKWCKYGYDPPKGSSGIKKKSSKEEEAIQAAC